MLTLSVILSGLAFLVAGMTFVLVLVLLGKRADKYPSEVDLAQRLTTVVDNQSKLWRYLEALDDQTGGRAHQVLCPAVPSEPGEAGH